MKKTVSHLSQEKQDELKKVSSILRELDTEGIDKIILYGSYARGDYKLQRGKEKGKKSDFDILIVVDTEKVKQKVSSSMNKNLFPSIQTSVQVIVETIGDVNYALMQSQFFFSDILKEGILLHNGGHYQFASPKIMNGKDRKKLAEEDFAEWFRKATEFFIGSQDTVKRNFLGKAAFELQQVVELCYTTIEMVFTHYNPYEHKLAVLRERVAEFDPRVLKILSTKTKEENKLFEKLDFAYIGGRYKSEEEFPVTNEQLAYWNQETEKLLDFTEKICKQQIERFGEGNFFDLKNDFF